MEITACGMPGKIGQNDQLAYKDEITQQVSARWSGQNEPASGRKRKKNVVDKSKYWCTEQNNQKSGLTNQYSQSKRCRNWEHEKSDQKAEFR